jgi:acyl carrier protein
MDTAEIYQKLTSIFRDVFDDDGLAIAPELKAADIEEWDSLQHIRLVIAVEREFALKFSASEIGALENVGEFAELIRRKL